MTNAEDPRQSSGDQIDTGGGPVIQGDTNITNGDFVSRDKYQTINNNGLSYADAKEIYLDLFNNNFLELTQKAADVAIKRVNKFIDKFLEELRWRNPEGIEHAEDPDFQYSLFVAQREYALSGDDELADLLVDLLVDRTREETKSLTRIALSESISVVSKLTSDQIAALTVVFLIRHTKMSNINSYAALEAYARWLKPWVSLLPKKNSAYQHLESMRCCSVQLSLDQIPGIFLDRYKWLFCKGFSSEKLEEKGINLEDLHDLVTPYRNRNDLFQLNATDALTFQDLAIQKRLKPKTIGDLMLIQYDSLMSEEEVTELLKSLDPALNDLIEAWDKSNLSIITLTSIGMAIGHANYKRLTGGTEPLSQLM